MYKVITGALSLLLIILVLRVALPEAAELVIEILVKILGFLNQAIDYSTVQVLQ